MRIVGIGVGVLFSALLSLSFAGVAAAYPPGTATQWIINASTFAPGAAVTVTVQHATPGGVLTMYIESTPVVIASGVVVPASGSTSISAAVPAGYSGNHTIAVRSTAGESISFPIAVTPGGPSRYTPSSVQITVDCAANTADVVAIGNIGAFRPISMVVSGDGGTASDDVNGPGADGAYRFEVPALPITRTQTSITLEIVDSIGGYVDYVSTYAFSRSSCTTSTPPTATPTVPPTSDGATTTSSNGGVAASSSGSGTLATTGQDVAVGAGVGLATLVAGTGLLLASRRRRGEHQA